MLEKLRKDYDFNTNYYRLGFFSNSLLLNKKLYLLYNFFNKKRKFFLLKKKQKAIGPYFINYFNFNTLNNNICNYKKKSFDYFFKWSSSFLNISDINLNNNSLSLNKKKFLKSTNKNLNYTICDDIFSDYKINKKKTFFFLNKSSFTTFLLSKFNKKFNLKLNNYYYHYFLNFYNILNLNYFNLITKIYWNNIFNFKFLKKHLSLYVLKTVYKFLFFYNNNKNVKKSNLIYSLNYNIFLQKKFFITIKKKYLTNKLKQKFLDKNFFFKYFFKKKFFNNFFFRYNKRFRAFLLKKNILPTIRSNILKNIKKGNFINFLKKKKYKNKELIIRNFLLYNNIIKNYKFGNYKDKLTKIRKKKRRNLKLIKKLKKFNYVPNKSPATRETVYGWFKKGVLKKFKRKKHRKIISRYIKIEKKKKKRRCQ